jgi:hypothetical protein
MAARDATTRACLAQPDIKPVPDRYRLTYLNSLALFIWSFGLLGGAGACTPHTLTPSRVSSPSRPVPPRDALLV